MTSCGVEEAGKTNELDGFSFKNEVIEAYEILENLERYGSCEFALSLKKIEAKRYDLTLDFKYRHDEDEPLVFEEAFSNHLLNISKVDVDHSWFSSGKTKITLEKVDIRAAPAHLYKLNIQVLNNVVQSVRVRVFYASIFNLVRDITC